jgi:DNA repair protein RadA/Sms
VRPAFRCGECGATPPRWVGRCGECQAWGSVVEVAAPPSRAAGLRGPLTAGAVTNAAVPITEVDLTKATLRPTGVGELDRVLGGGLVPGAVVLVAGEPGVGKSTLLLDVAASFARSGQRALYVSGEESASQVRLRAERTEAMHPGLYLAEETDLAAVLGHIEALGPDLLILDSVQTVASAEVEGSAGGVAQVREVAAALIRVAKSRGMATLLVGHVTKEGTVAGPRVLEHLVDVVLQFEGERHSALRLLRAVKNRYGAADEVGCFEQTETGIVGVPDPSGLFLSRQPVPVPGTCLTVAVEGRRAMVAEVQALVVPRPPETPMRRGVSGLDAARLNLLLAVAEKRGGVRLAGKDVYASTVGGVRLLEPAVDLALALAVASSVEDLPLPPGFAAVGEVGLAGEVRRVPGMSRRVAEAARLGLTHVIAPRGEPQILTGVEVIEVDDIVTALSVVGVGRR